MRKVNLITLMSLINQLEDETENILREIRYNSIIEKDRELDGTETIIKDCEDFSKLYSNYTDKFNKLIDYKNKLNEANNTINETIDSSVAKLLIQVKEHRKRLYFIEELLKNKESKRRINIDGVSYYSIKQLNYDIDSVKAKKETITKVINILEEQINTINSTTFVEIEE